MTPAAESGQRRPASARRDPGRSLWKIAASAFLLVAALGSGRVAAAERAESSALRAALEAAVREEIARRNEEEIEQRETREAEVHGPRDRPYLARTSYREITGQFEITRFEPPTARVRLSARVLEKRVTNVAERDPLRALDSAPWEPSQIVYLLEGTWHWDGKRWHLRGGLQEQAVPSGIIPAHQGLEELLERQMR